MDKKISKDLEDIMDNRALYHKNTKLEDRYIIEMGREHFISCAMPIISEGDVIGCVVSAAQSGVMDGDKISSDVEIKLIQTAAIFLGKQMEN